MTRDTLTRQQIIEATIDLLDKEGLEGLSMRVLGTQLSSAATAVYWHVGSKDNLIALAGDHVWNEIALPDFNVLDWRTAATMMATGLHDMLGRHQWLVRVFGSHMIYGPGKARHDNHCLAIYEAAGFRGKLADQTTTAVFIFVLGNALARAAESSFQQAFSKASLEVQKEMRDKMAKARESALLFPRLSARLKTAGNNYGTTPRKTFEFGLKVMLDGIESQANELRR